MIVVFTCFGVTCATTKGLLLLRLVEAFVNAVHIACALTAYAFWTGSLTRFVGVRSAACRRGR